ncbi:MAG: AtpZ/AtpI family protein [Rhodospirillaceae bacterium]|nr:AtpZ/AtpI family protein [Rhodospirillaceae bacterium]
MTDREKPPSLEDVEARLAVVRASAEQEREKSERRRASGAAQSVGFKIAAELVASVLVGAGLGYFLDQWLETKPVFLIAMIFLGFAAALMNIYRIVKGMDQAVGLGRAMREAQEKQAAQDKTKH